MNKRPSYKTADTRRVRAQFAFKQATHRVLGQHTTFSCVPVVSHLNHSGSRTGLTTVQVVDGTGSWWRPNELVTVGTDMLLKV